MIHMFVFSFIDTTKSKRCNNKPYVNKTINCEEASIIQTTTFFIGTTKKTIIHSSTGTKYN